ncbi:serine threonine- kinase gad8 [Trichoderma arundinaceum]|uniref:Serine threonine-kinase gad8 n=1 Tax=Trichoderma arundinaceum TaxID=490622 RepID=A0A395N8X0_TRIAR|nr:serine threonine- kinase gad8 [Trichoderma arundinaceum]
MTEPVTLHEAVGLSAPDDYKELSNDSKHSHGLCVGGLIRCKRCNLPQTLVEYDKRQIPLSRPLGTTENPKWIRDYDTCKFYVRRFTELTISFYLCHPNGSETSQDAFIGVARVNPFDALQEFESKWLMIEDGPGKVHVSFAYATLENEALKEEEFSYDLSDMAVSHSGLLAQCKKDDTKAKYFERIVSTDRLSLSELTSGLPSRINHPFISTTTRIFQSEHGLHLLSPFSSGGRLFNHPLEQKCFNVERSKIYLAEILCAVEYLHDVHEIFAWLKPRSVLLDENGHITLCGFGLFLSEISHEKPRIQHGWPEYPAPEMLLGQGEFRMADWWTLGIFLYTMLTGLSPFYDKDPGKVTDTILNQPIQFPEHLPPDAQDIMVKLLNRDPKQRLGAHGVSEIKTHPFFEGIHWHEILQRKHQPAFKPQHAAWHLEHHGVPNSLEPPPSELFVPFSFGRMYPEHRRKVPRSHQEVILADNDWDLVWEESDPRKFHFCNRRTGEKKPIPPQAAARSTVRKAAQDDESIIAIPSRHQKLEVLGAALQAGYENVISQLLEYGVDLNVNIIGADRKSPLLWAVKHENLGLVRLFLDKGADANFFGSDYPIRDAPLSTAVRIGNQEIAEVLVGKTDRVASTRALCVAIDQDDPPMVKLLLANGVQCEYSEGDRPPPYVPTDFGTTDCRFGEEPDPDYIPPLVRAVVYGNLDMVRLLLSYGADANVGYHDVSWIELQMEREELIKFGCGRVIHLAMELRQREMVQLLLDSGADIKLGRPAWEISILHPKERI